MEPEAALQKQLEGLPQTLCDVYAKLGWLRHGSSACNASSLSGLWTYTGWDMTK